MSSEESVSSASSLHRPADHSGRGGMRGDNVRLALVLASIAAAFFAGIVLKYILFPTA